MALFKFTSSMRNPIVGDNRMTKALRLGAINLGPFDKKSKYYESILPIYYGMGRVYPNKKSPRSP